MIRRNNVGRRPELFRRIIPQIPEMNIGKIQLSLPLCIKIKSHPFFRECLPHMITFSFVRQKSAH